MSKPGINTVPLLPWLAKNGTRCILLQTSLKHAARQFSSYDPSIDLIQITECGPEKHFFLFSTFFTSQPLRLKKVCNMVGNVQHTSAKRQKFNKTWSYKLMIMLFKLRSILKGVFSINVNRLLINWNDLRLAFQLKIIRLAHVLFEMGLMNQI